MLRIGAGIVVGGGLLVGVVFWAVYGWVRDSAPSQAAQVFLSEHPIVQADLGEHIRLSGMLQGKFSDQRQTGSARFTLPLSGSLGKGMAEVQLAKDGGLWRVTSGFYQGRDGVRRELVAQEEEGDDSRKQLVHAHRLYKSGKSQEAIAELNALLERFPDDAEALYWRAQIRARLGENDAAREDILRAVALKVDLREAYQLHDSLLAREHRWEEIIHAWTEYLERHPEDDVALLERAGTWHHQGDEARALEDLKRSCELDNAQACALHRRQTGQ
ncbi:tetratricopeptide repeat protein [Hyalangium minutum]|uniref:Uncharacterized protein n=1 Tax=Hyalangium minutum TaxID=394096 RepID=A0A085WUE9_9BACT|nr:tetratricopeptide repeat protein [Hyalangium minutum]KFE71312.1 hypothetical protein DB31_3442 [Hyalangium minutum]